jgi:hypothetical protein
LALSWINFHVYGRSFNPLDIHGIYGDASPGCEKRGEESVILGKPGDNVWPIGLMVSLFDYSTGRVMRTFIFVLLLVLLILSQGCSADSFKRTIYDVFQNWGDQDCHRDPGRECLEPKSYDEYQRERNAPSTD